MPDNDFPTLQPQDTPWSAIRALACVAGAAVIAWHDPGAATYALGVVALVASPSLAKAVVAPKLARVLASTNTGSNPAVTP